MKTQILTLCLTAALTGCMSHNFPKDAYIKGAHSKIVTPWGTSELVIDEAATGTAAKHASLPEGTMPGTAKRILSDLVPASGAGVK